MRGARLPDKTPRIPLVTFLAVLAFTLGGNNTCHSQSLPQIRSDSAATKPQFGQEPAKTSVLDPLVSSQPTEKTATAVDGFPRTRTEFRIERLAITNGAELVTIFAGFKGGETNEEIPLVSVVRDTLGDADGENDRLRYVWMLTYSQPTLRQHLAAAIPFFYKRVANKRSSSSNSPPILLNISSANQKAWSKIVWFGLQHFVLDTEGLPLKAASRTYRNNWSDYRAAHVTQALTVLSLYGNMRPKTRDENETIANLGPLPESATNGEPFVRMLRTSDESRLAPAPAERAAISVADALELRARLMLTEKTFGGFTSPDTFPHFVEKQTIQSRDAIGHNWELLRQSAEGAGLYFEPLTMPDGSATHALLWIAKSEVDNQTNRNPNLRFLNISNPWTDERVRNWSGYTAVRYFDSDDHALNRKVPGARAVEMIPLAVYGLDNPKIPALLVDFRESLNPKRRELSHRVLTDVARNLLGLSVLDAPYLLGRTAFDWITHRRGMDINQKSRLRSYAQLKLLLTLNSGIDSNLRAEIESRLEAVSHDPLANDRNAEIQLARQQYKALLSFAEQPNGLAAKIDRDRRAEMTSLRHGRAMQILFRLGSALTFGRYIHREQATPELFARIEQSRRTEYHLSFLREVVASTPQIEVAWNLNEVNRSLQFVADNASGLDASAARLAAKVFPRTKDNETRRLCLDALYRIKGKTAKNELLYIYRGPETGAQWRSLIADYLRRAVTEDQTLSPAQAKLFLDQVGGK